MGKNKSKTKNKDLSPKKREDSNNAKQCKKQQPQQQQQSQQRQSSSKSPQSSKGPHVDVVKAATASQTSESQQHPSLFSSPQLSAPSFGSNNSFYPGSKNWNNGHYYPQNPWHKRYGGSQPNYFARNSWNPPQNGYNYQNSDFPVLPNRQNQGYDYRPQNQRFDARAQNPQNDFRNRPPNNFNNRFRYEGPRNWAAVVSQPKPVDVKNQRPPKSEAGEELEDIEKQAKAKEEVQSKVEMLKKLLETKGQKRPRSQSELSEEEPTRNHPETETVSKRQRLLDLNVTSEDYREIGTGRVIDSDHQGSSTDHLQYDVHNPDSIEEYSSRFKETCQLNVRPHPPVQRIANQPVVLQNKLSKKKKPSDIESPPVSENVSSSVDLEKEKRKRLEYEQVAERLKPLVLKNDTPWLSAMVNSAHTNTQRILLSKLLEENRTAISKELNTLRFRDVRSQSSGSDISASESDDLGAIIEIDLVNLPDLFITTIENLIKKERPEIVVLDDENRNPPEQESNLVPSAPVEDLDSRNGGEEDEDIMEVPVPPKLVPLIELDEDEAEVALEEKATSCQRDVETQIGHTPIVASNQNLTQTTNVHQNATVNHPQNLFDLRSHFQNRSRLFENQRVQIASQVEKPIINSPNPGTSQQRQHLVRSPKKKTKENSSNVMNAQSSTATYQIQSTNTFPDSAARSQSTNTIPDLAIRRTNTFPDPELAARSTVDDESPNHLSVDELFPILADEERSIVDELRHLDQRTSALNEQMSQIIKDLRIINARRPGLLSRLDYLREFKQGIAMEGRDDPGDH